MPRDAELVKLRNTRIREVYDRMRKKRVGNKPMYTVEYIISVISTEHVFVGKKVIERVLYGEK